jgi:hypothetical protein
MTTNNFIIEVYFKTLNNQTGGVILSKYGAAGSGYQVDITGGGKIRFSILENGTVLHSISGAKTVNDNEWHHALIEVDRNAGIAVFIDGISSNGELFGTLPAATVSLSNTSDFLAGKNKDGNFFNGIMDFMRLSKGNLTEAQTSFEELYKWEFDGPFSKDFSGNIPIGKRDAGALETGEKVCDLAVDPVEISHEITGGTDLITVEASTGWELAYTNGDFFNTSIQDNAITVTTSNNAGSPGKQGSIGIFGCNETIKVIITLKGDPTALDESSQDEIKIFPNPSYDRIIQINVPDTWTLYHVLITDMSGKVILNRQLDNSNEKVSLDFNPGVYVVSLENNQYSCVKKVIIE